MSSLLTTASNWTSDDTTTSKKRVSTMRKTVKMRHPTPDESDKNIQFVPNPSNNQAFQPSSIEDIQQLSNDRNSRVNSLINAITSVDTSNETNKMGDFKPISPPTINVKKDMESVDVSREYTPSSQTYLDASSQHKDLNTKSTYEINDGDASKYSNYMKSYDAPKNNYTKPYYANMGISNSHNISDSKLMEKINYMLHMLEEQQHEKTNNITEEFILYTFLGVFIIFIVDAFARTGKYTR